MNCMFLSSLLHTLYKIKTLKIVFILFCLMRFWFYLVVFHSCGSGSYHNLPVLVYPYLQADNTPYCIHYSIANEINTCQILTLIYEIISLAADLVQSFQIIPIHD